MQEIVDVALDLEPLTGRTARVVRLEAEERLFEITRIEIELLLDEPPDTSEIVDRPASIRMRTAEDRERTWHGIVWAGRVRPRPQHDYALVLEIRPRLYRLTLGRDCRIFQGRTVPAVIDDVLLRTGLPEASWAWFVSGRYPVHTNIVQYGESDYQLLRRLLAEEGLSFTIENRESDELVRFFDSPRGLAPIEGEQTLWSGNLVGTSRSGIWDLTDREVVTSGGVALRDYDPAQPQRALTYASRSGSGPEVYLHPGGFHEEDAGRQRAERALHGLRWGRRRILGRSNVPWMEAGRVFGIEGHDRADLAETFATVSVTHRCERGEEEAGAWGYANRFEAIPAGTPLRAVPMDGAPRAAHLQKAFVTGPLLAEPHADALGRVKVRFPWDRSGVMDDRSSTWCRVGQMQLPGPMIIPRAGFEVLIHHERSDQDRSLLLGHRYNAERPAPYPLPGHTATSSWQSATLQMGIGANELRFDDTAGREEIYIHASMTLRQVVLNDAVRRVTRMEDVAIGIRQALNITQDFVSVVGADRLISVGHNQSLQVDESYSDRIGGSLSLVCNRRRVEVGADLNERTLGALTRTVGPIEVSGAITGYTHRTLRDSTTRARALWAEIVGADRSSNVRGNRTETVSALKLVEAGSTRLTARGGVEERYQSLEVTVEADRTDDASGALSFAAQGDLSLTARSISITGTSHITIAAGASAITLAASGTVTLEAPRVNLRNADSLGSAVRVN